MTYLFLASIGPIQSFIASARRTRDLWFGSTLLSELSKTVAYTIARNEDNMLIFPAPGAAGRLEPNTDLKVPNKILARITNDPEMLGKSIEKEIQTNVKTLYGRLFKALQSYEFDQQIAEEQIENLVEYTWVAIKEDDIEVANEHYHETRKRLEGLLAARKNTRNYSKVTWQSENPKSSIDGKLESVIPETFYSGNRESLEKQGQNALILFRQFHAGKSERLSGVDLLKRMGEFNDEKTPQQDSSTFFSTSHIASLPYLQRLAMLSATSHTTRAALRASWNTYALSVRTIHLPNTLDKTDNTALAPVYERISASKETHPIINDWDGALLYAERLVEVANNQDKLLLATRALQNFFSTVNEYVNEENLSPSPYYAIIVADGDGMGKIIDYESRQGPEQHQKISRALDTFDERVKKLVEGKDSSQGGLIYSGGDDVLAFVPLHNVLACVKGLSGAFKECLKGFRNEDGKEPTLSVGVAIVHHLFPLTDALEQARGAEKAAKAVPGKNALAIKLYKRSGEEYTVSGHWENLDLYLEQLILHYQAKRIPKTLPYDLRESLLRLTALKDERYADKLITVIKADAKRILERKLKVPKRKKDSETASLLRLLAGRIDIDLDESPVLQQEEVRKSDENKSDLLIDGLENKQHFKISAFHRVMQIYIHELIIAKELADALTLAGGQPTLQAQEAHV